MLRVITNKSNNLIHINGKTSYHILDLDDSLQHECYHSSYIIHTQPLYSLPLINKKSKECIQKYKSMITQFNNTYPIHLHTYKYLSNYTTIQGTNTLLPVTYPIDNFYVNLELSSLNVPRNIINMQANNTLENYFMSNVIKPTDYHNKTYMHIAYINHFIAGATKFSNIQIYDAITHDEFDIIYTGSNTEIMPSFGFKDYELNKLPINGIIIVERCCYGITNNNALNYNVLNQCHIYII